MAALGNIASRTAVVLGVANHRSIAWSCVQSLLEKDFRVVFTYQNERFAKTAEGLIAIASNPDNLFAVPCDVQHEIPILFQERLPHILGDHDFRIQAMVHSVAYAPSLKEGTLLSTSRDSFLLAHDISAYSFLELIRLAQPFLDTTQNQEASVVALSYLGAARAVPHYNVMGPVKASLEALVRGLALELGPTGIRVNAVSAGPVSTMAARGIREFDAIKDDVQHRSMLRRNITVEEVGETVAFLATSSGITGQTIYVDGGYSAVAGPRLQ
jgi:enoyl-[acyl-carrier protein] reductase I